MQPAIQLTDSVGGLYLLRNVFGGTPFKSPRKFLTLTANWLYNHTLLIGGAVKPATFQQKPTVIVAVQLLVRIFFEKEREGFCELHGV